MKKISYKDLEKMYMARVSLKCKRALGDKIYEDYPQLIIRKKLKDEWLEDADYRELSKRGGWGSKEYPGLHYLVEVFISPFTTIESLVKKIVATGDKELIKEMLP